MWDGVITGLAIMLTVSTMMMRKRHGDTAPSGTAADTLVASLRAEPRSFNRYVARDLTTTVLTILMHDTLVRINRLTNDLEPELAQSWDRLPDGRTYRLHLRRGVRFSDGAPFTSEDVAFSFRAINDPSVDSVLADSLQVRGKPLAVAVEDAATIVVRFPTMFGPGLRMLDGVPIYPRHRLESTLQARSFRSAWGPSTSPSDIAGLGPFVLKRYEPGQRLTLDRNPYYWKRDQQLPKLAHVVLEVVPDQDSELLQLEQGGIDLTQSELRPVDVPKLARTGVSRHVTVTEAGISLDGDLFWLNLTSANARDPRSRWLQHPDFRRAIAQSIDRREFIDTVYLGAAIAADSVISQGNRAWHVVAPPPGYDVAGAKRLLASLGLSAAREDARLRDSEGREVRFTLLTQKGNTSLERGAAVIREHLARVGIEVDVVALEAGTLVDYITRGNYDAAYFRLLTTDTDPALNLDFWLSSGSAHVWSPRQRVPSMPWEAEIDSLMNEVSTSLDETRRRSAFASVQRIMAREIPVLCFAFPRLAVAVGSRLTDATPAAFRPPVLWNPDRIAIRGGG